MEHQNVHSTGEGYGHHLPRRRLGRSELIVPGFALGGAPLGTDRVSDDEAVACIQYAVEQGLDYFDTSAGYGGGTSEKRFGLALEGVPRASYVLSTKTGSHPDRRGDYSWDGTMWSVENSLRRLKTDYFDLVLVHDPFYHNPEGMKPVMAKDGAVDALEHLKEQGVIRAIGLGQKRFDHHQIAIESGRFDAILTFGNYHPLDTSAAEWLLPLAAKHDVGVINGSAMMHGLLGGLDPDEVYARRDSWGGSVGRLLPAARTFYNWCQEKGVDMGQVIFQFCLRQTLIHCTLTGARTTAQLEQNLRAATTPLPEEIWDELVALGLPQLSDPDPENDPIEA
jgi:aryl-alcohol dehydrogenase-like predicted oxidoreductase